MLSVELRLGGLITIGGRSIALGQTHALLDAVAGARSVRGASERLGLSYRTVWSRIGALQEAFGRSLVTMIKGHGSRLSPDGDALLSLLSDHVRDFAGPIAEAEARLARALVRLASPPPRTVRIALSHEPLLLRALSGLAAPRDVAVVGSSNAVEALLAGMADVAGFHIGDESGARTAGDPTLFSELFADAAVSVRPLFRREQGLIVAAGNPLGLRGLADIAATGARFINRQRGSGTRLWLDRLLAEAGLSPSAIRGYDVEEFTHQAVAAIVASGAADCGMGLRAAAAQFRLGFLPLGHETYYLAARTADADLVEALAGAVDAAREDWPGYGPVAAPMPPSRDIAAARS